MTFSWKIIYYPEVLLEFLIFWNLNFRIVQTNLYGEMDKTKVLGLDKLYNFIVDDFSFDDFFSKTVIYQT